MAEIAEYILKLNDQISGKVYAVSGATMEAVNKFAALDEKTKTLQNTTKDFGNSLVSLRQKIDLLKQERELIPEEGLNLIRQYNREIKSLETNIHKLETANGGKVKSWAKDAINQVPAIATNPIILAGTAMAYAGKTALAWNEGMAKINATTQLSEPELQKLSEQIRKLGVDAGADLSRVPDAFEKINGQINNVNVSTDILGIALKGAKAGFTDVDVVAGALAQTMSAVGTANTNASEVMNVLLAAKRVGAGEFKDFANYIPSLVASAKAVNISFKDTAGLFAYMTASGFDAAKSATLLENAFSALSKSEVTDGMAKMGISVYDANHKMKPTIDIMNQLKGEMAGLNDEAKTKFLEKIGLTDAQARQAFMALTADTQKLQDCITATTKPVDELKNALAYTNNPARSLQEAWSKIQSILISTGSVLTTLINPALWVLMNVMNGVLYVIGLVGSLFAGWYNQLQTGNPLVWGLTTALGALALMYALYYAWINRTIIIEQLSAAWHAIVTAAKWTHALATGGLTLSQLGLNAAFWACPIVWVIALFAGLVAAVVLAWNKFEWFRAGIYAIWEVMKGFGSMLKTLVIDRIHELINGISGIGKALMHLFKGEWKAAWETAKKAATDLSGVNSMQTAWNSTKQLGTAWNTGYAKGQTAFAANHADNTRAGTKKTLDLPSSTPQLPAPTDNTTDNKLDAIHGGGGRNITINLGKFMETFTVQTTNIKEGAEEVQVMFEDMFLKVLQGVNVAMGN